MQEFFESEFYQKKEFKNAYGRLNYEIMETPDFPVSKDDNPKNLKTCAIYFTSNGWYSRENIDSFKTLFYIKNRYEWKRNLVPTAQKHIFLRDVYASWYVKGINSKINTQDKVIEFLKEQTKGYRVITMGTSGGGYMATLCGIKLNAYKIFNFCGQYALRFDSRRIDWGFCYNSIEDLVREYKGDSLYYFAAKDFESDIPEYTFALSCKKVKTFLFKTNIHGVPFSVTVLQDVINMPKKKLDKFYAFYKGKEINSLSFSKKVSGIKFIFPILQKKFKQLKKLQKTN